MKKILWVLLINFLVANYSYSDIRKIEEVRSRFYDYSTSRIGTYCIDGYKFVITRAPDSKSIVQAFEEKNGNSVPSKC